VSDVPVTVLSSFEISWLPAGTCFSHVPACPGMFGAFSKAPITTGFRVHRPWVGLPQVHSVGELPASAKEQLRERVKNWLGRVTGAKIG
jgi:hypothetical protein